MRTEAFAAANSRRCERRTGRRRERAPIASCAALALLAWSLPLLAPANALAGTTWDGGGANTNIDTAANWNDNVSPTLTGGVSSLTFATAGATATINTAVNVLDITINRDANFGIADGAGTLTLGSGGIVVSLPTANQRSHTISESVILGASQTWTVGGNGGKIAILNVTNTISDGGSGYSLTKSGSGQLTLTAANTYTGSTIFAAGGGITYLQGNNGSILNTSAIRVGTGASFSVGATGTTINRIGDTVGVTLAGGALIYQGQTNFASAETVGTLTIAAGGQSSVTATLAGTGNADLTFGSASLDSIARTGTGSTVNFVSGTTNVGRVYLPKVTLTNGILGGWATVGMSDYRGSFGFATVSGGTVAAFTAYEKAYTAASTSVVSGSWSASDNVFFNTVSNTVSVTLAASATANSLAFGSSGASNVASTLNLGGNRLTVASGGVLFMAPSTTSNRQITNGSLTAGDGTAPAELFVTSNRTHNSGYDIISAQIVDNNGQAVALVKGGQNGANAVQLTSTTSSYSGGTYINAGRLQVAGDGSLGAAAGPVRFATGANAALGVSASTTFNASRTFSADTGGAVVIAPSYNANVVVTLAGAITGAGGFTKSTINDSSAVPVNGGPLAGTLILTGTGNTYEGPTSVQSGILQVGDGTATNGSLPNREVTLGVGGTNAATLHFANPQALSFTAAISGGGDLIKSGAGTLTLGTANSHAYGTTIRAGVVEVASDGALGAAYDGSLAYVVVTNMGAGYTGANVVPVTIAAPPTGVQATASGTSTFVTAQNQLSYITLSGSGSGYVAPPAVTIGQVAGAGTNATAVAYVKGLLTLDGGTLRTTAAVSSSRAVYITSSGGGIDTGGFDSTFSGVLNGAGGFKKSGLGSLTLTNQNTYQGNTTVSGGTLALGANGSFDSSPTITVGDTGSTGSVLDLTAKSSGFTFGSGQTVKGIGTIRMANGKTLTINGTLAPGNSPGTLTVADGDLVLGGSSVTSYEINGTDATVGGGINDLTTVSGSLTLGGTLNVSTTPAFDVFGNRTYRVFNYATSGTGSLAGSMAVGTTPDANYLYSLDIATAGQVNLFVQRRAAQAATFTLTSGSVTRALVNATVALSGSITNTSPAGSAALVLGLGSTGQLSVAGFTTGSVAGATSAAVAGTINAGSTVGVRTWTVTNTDSGAITTTSTATGSLTVFDAAQPSFTALSATTTWLVDIGSFNQNTGDHTYGFSIYNLLTDPTYTADLTLVSITDIGTPSNSLSIDLTPGSFGDLAAGGTSNWLASLSTLTTGSFTNQYQLNFVSSKDGQSLGGPQSMMLTVTGIVVVPEPGAIALAGIGLAAVGWMARKRRGASRG